MPGRVVRRRAARRDVVEAFLYIAEKGSQPSLQSADRFLEALENVLGLLAENPEMGRRWQTATAGLEELRWFPVRGFEHLVFYIPMSDGIRFVRLLHGKRDIPPQLEELKDLDAE